MNTEMSIIKTDNKGNFGLWLQHHRHVLTQQELNKLDATLKPHIKYSEDKQKYNLPFGIMIIRYPSGAARIDSELRNTLSERSADVLEALLLAMASEGINLHDSRLDKAIETAVESIANNS